MKEDAGEAEEVREEGERVESGEKGEAEVGVEGATSRRQHYVATSNAAA